MMMLLLLLLHQFLRRTNVLVLLAGRVTAHLVDKIQLGHIVGRSSSAARACSSSSAIRQYGVAVGQSLLLLLLLLLAAQLVDTAQHHGMHGRCGGHQWLGAQWIEWPAAELPENGIIEAIVFHSPPRL